MFPAASCRHPRLPMKVPRSGTATISPCGVTRFRLGTFDLPAGLPAILCCTHPTAFGWLVKTGGHFDGFQVLHRPAGAGGKSVLLCGDQPYVRADRNWVSFM